MLFTLRKRTQLEAMQEDYQTLMRKSFNMALKDKAKSEELNTKAQAILSAIRNLE